MGQIIIQRNPLSTAHNEIAEHEGPLIDWVVGRFPDGFPAKTLVTFNGSHLEIRDMDRVVGPGDEVYLLVEPGAPVAAWAATAALGTLAAQAAVGAAVSFAISYVSNWLRGSPDTSSNQGERQTPSPTYSLTLPTNQARLGETMPVVFGTAKVVPDIVSQPYRAYKNDLPFPEYLFMMVAIGRGDHEFNREDIYIGDSSIGSKANPLLGPDVIDYKSFPATRHGNAWGVLQTNCRYANNDGKGGNDGQPTVNWDSPVFYEDVETSVEVDNQELRHTIVVGNYVANHVGSVTREMQVDLEFPQGLYELNPEYPGQIFGSRVDFTVYTRLIDDDGNDLGGATMSHVFFITLGTTAPVRQTITIGGASLAYGRYRVSMRRSTADSTSSWVFNRSYWTGLRAFLNKSGQDGVTLPDYSDVYVHMHLVVFRIKATEGIAHDAASRISINATRVLYTAGIVTTSNPADAMTDMLTNTVYGAGRPLSELDEVKIDYLRTKWATNAGGFNAVYDRVSNIWTAMQQALRLGDATPVIHGGMVTVSEDIYDTSQHVFNESNIVDGSVAATYSFNDTTDYDCYEVEYLDTESFVPRYVRYPDYGVIPLEVQYFGCTSEAMAAHQAQFLWFKRTFRRKRISFKTEAMGNLPLVGDKLSVEHPVVTVTGSEDYIVEAISPESQFSVTIEAIIDNFIYSPIPTSTAVAAEQEDLT